MAELEWRLTPHGIESIVASINSIRNIPPKIVAWHRELLEEHTDRTGACWIWKKTFNRDGYGQTSVGGRSILVHRLSYLMHKGDIPPGMVVRHCCPGGDNRACVNPDHLVLGTKGDNNRDTVARGKGGRGGPQPESNAHIWIESAPLASDRLIHELAGEGLVPPAIAEQVGLPEEHVILVMSVRPDTEGRRPGSRFERRFWSKVEKTKDCWLWRATTIAGYGRVRIAQTDVGAHQVSWRLYRGPIPDGLVVCHNCPGGDKPTCVNPDHLFVASQGDNLRDALRKKRGRVHKIW